MAIKFGRKKYRQHYVLYTVLTAFLLCAVFLTMVSRFYTTAEEEAYENLHVQTKQIKDDMILQLTSDRENLSTMANFAAKLYSDGEDYDLMFDSFKAIGLIENIGILNPDNTFVTKAGSTDLQGLVSFDEEQQKGAYISGRVQDLTHADSQMVRSAVPITVDGETVGILYGVIPLERISRRYARMAQELDAQLFVYDKAKGDLVLDTVHDTLGNISFLKDRRYNDGYSYEQLMTTDKGFSSFASAYRDENLYLHYSTIEDFDWVIAMGRYDSQVFAKTHELFRTLLVVFLFMATIIAVFVLSLMVSERRINAVTTGAAEIRRVLLETAGNQNHIADALERVCTFARSRSAVFFNTDDEDYRYTAAENASMLISPEDRKYFMGELFRYGVEYHQLSGKAVNILCITPNKHLLKTNPDFYTFLKACKIREVSFSATVTNANHISVLAVINARRSNQARMLAEKIAACFSIALNNKNHLSKTEQAATTDALTGVYNRVAYRNDLTALDGDKAANFSCIYVDVNELHLRNNKYGHAAGDEMLMYVANTLKEVFFGHKVYRMGGDEFLVFCRDVDPEEVKQSITRFTEQLVPRDYHVAVGMSYRTQNTNTEEMVREAEVRMYEEKALYYQNKEQNGTNAVDGEYVQTKTGIQEIDTMLSVLKEKYNGIYRVSLDSDTARRILMPAYLNYHENEEHFTKLFSKYVEESVSPDYHRSMLGFINYDAIRHRLLEGKTPRITYKKNNGDTVILSVYKLGDAADQAEDTLWVFAKE